MGAASRVRRTVLGVAIVTAGYLAAGSVAAPVASSSQQWIRLRENPILSARDDLPILGDPAVIAKDGGFTMWVPHGFLVAGKPRVRIDYAISPDGLRWTWGGVALPTGDPGAWDSTTTETPSVLKDPDERDPSRRYKMWYSGVADETRGAQYGIGVAFSPDGRRFTRLPAVDSPFKLRGKVLEPGTTDGDIQAVADPSVLKIGGIYHMWYTTGMKGPPEVVISYATSPDGIHWTKYRGNPVLRPTAGWEKGNSWIVSTVAQPSVLWDGRRFEMWYASFLNFGGADHRTAGYGYAVSTDGIQWTKPESQPVFVTQRGPGEEAGLYTGPFVLRLDRTYWLFYPGVRRMDPHEMVINAARWNR